MIHAFMFALARMSSAAWIGAAVLFVIVAVDQTNFYKPPKPLDDAAAQLTAESSDVVPPNDLPTDDSVRRQIVARLAIERFPHYYATGSLLLGISFVSSLFLRRRYLKASRWALVMLFLIGAGGMMAYDYYEVFVPLNKLTLKVLENPSNEFTVEFDLLHQHSKMINAAQLLLTFLASFLLCMPGTRPEQPVILVQQAG
ncbi:hypothetical protein Pan44_54450 [Caulifigura coniformis]|uniref:DUF1772 domain-containing protein n=1 Tax=Caulifigura coniformis TaxID=2527983 RepID=A0A517SMP4_9PLAN|nr:hypothetical protein [Caulifigura coniformis]QDT57376.1 hypothetical protein Pan44_54450 [Caulifigura coniformis]